MAGYLLFYSMWLTNGPSPEERDRCKQAKFERDEKRRANLAPSSARLAQKRLRSRLQSSSSATGAVEPTPAVEATPGTRSTSPSAPKAREQQQQRGVGRFI
eukprot:CAMPEP_0174855484 /NCGR_PEP_ID=MMETSP1114-20130205/33391_1 /TAXON_ID=312471 /ORGANISM="Neobodo designis, Strain CCAP 1951/1" /LENGTH=100 /DNA_ID=CAMNT_0016090223 /DNA_START=72 /DNA_END=374 /DNA_ORIENTATION=+